MGLKRTFPYVKFEGQFYPLVPIKVKRSGKSLSTTALIDSGANTTIFRQEIARRLGVPLDRGKAITFSGIAGKIKAWVHKLELEVLEDNPFRCAVAFSRQYTTSFNILGRHGFFEKYLVTLNEKKKESTIEEF